MDVDTAGRNFLNALTLYLGERLNNKEVNGDQLERWYRTYLEAIGFKPNTPLFDALTKHMGEMKTAGGVRK